MELDWQKSMIWTCRYAAWWLLTTKASLKACSEYDETKPQRSFYNEDKSITLHMSISYNTELSKYRKSFVARSCQSFARFKKMLQFFFAAVSEQAFSWFHHAIITRWLAHMMQRKSAAFSFLHLKSNFWIKKVLVLTFSRRYKTRKCEV